MEHVSAHYPVVMVVNVVRFVKLFLALMGVNANIFSDACLAAMTPFVMCVSASMDVKFATALKDAIFAIMDSSVWETVNAEIVIVMDAILEVVI